MVYWPTPPAFASLVVLAMAGPAPTPVSVNALVFDFVAEADQPLVHTPTTWRSQLGESNFGAFTCGGVATGSPVTEVGASIPGSVLQMGVCATDGPPPSDGHFLEGLYQEIALPAIGTGEKLRFQSWVGLEITNGKTAGLEFEVWIVLSQFERYMLSEVQARSDGQLTFISADLTKFNGMDIDLALRVESNIQPSTARDLGVWISPQITHVSADNSTVVRQKLYDVAEQAENQLVARWTSAFGNGTPLTLVGPTGHLADKDRGYVGNSGFETPPALFVRDWLILQANETPGLENGERSITGSFSGIYIPSNACDVRFMAELWVPQGVRGDTHCSVSVKRFGATVAREEIDVNATASGLPASASGYVPTPFEINLTGWQGEWLELELTVEILADNKNGKVYWYDPRIEIETPQVILAGEWSRGMVGPQSTEVERLVDILDFADDQVLAHDIHLENAVYQIDTTIDVRGAVLAIAPDPNINLVGYGAGGRTRLEHTVKATSVLALQDTPMFDVRDVDNMTFRNIDFDSGPEDVASNDLPFSQGVISNTLPPASETSPITFTWTGDPGFPDLASFLDVGGTFGAQDTQGHPRTAAPPHVIPFGGGHNHQVLLAVSTNAAQNVWDITVNNQNGIMNGRKWTITNKAGGHTVRVFRASGHIVMDEVRVFASWEVPLVTKAAEKTFFRDSSVAPPATGGRLLSCAGTAVFVHGNTFGPEIIRSRFEYVMDEVAHNRPMPALILNPVDLVPPAYRIERITRPFRVGDFVWAFDAESGSVGTRHEIIAVANSQMGEQDITLDGVAKIENPNYKFGDAGDAFYLDRASGRYALFHDNDASWGRAGVHMNGNDSVVSNNRLTLLNSLGIWTNTGIHTGFEGDRVSITGNTIDRCGFRDTSEGEVFAFHAPIFVGSTISGQMASTLPPTEHIGRTDVEIKGNIIKNWSRHAIVVYSCEDVRITDNELTNYPSLFWTVVEGWRSYVFLHGCKDVVVQNNTPGVDFRAADEIDGRILVVNMDPSVDIVATGNEYIAPNLDSTRPEVQHIHSFSRLTTAPSTPTASAIASHVPLTHHRMKFISTSTGLSGIPSVDYAIYDFGDGSSGSVRLPGSVIHDYEMSDTYEVTMAVSNGNGIDYYPFSVIVP
jgi:hypothetical protein